MSLEYQKDDFEKRRSLLILDRYIKRQEIAKTLVLNPKFIDACTQYANALKEDFQDDFASGETQQFLYKDWENFDKSNHPRKMDAFRFFLVKHIHELIVDRHYDQADDLLSEITAQGESERAQHIYAFSYDFANGAGYVLGNLVRACPGDKSEFEDRGIAGANAISALSLQIIPQSVAKEGLREIRTHLQMLLEKDPSGFQVVDYSFERVKQGNDQSDWPCITKFRLLGGNFATEAYKRIYTFLLPGVLV